LKNGELVKFLINWFSGSIEISYSAPD